MSDIRIKPGGTGKLPAVPVPAATVRAALAKIGGDPTPAAVVEAASAPGHPLHPCFTWDDTEAARRYREVQATILIRVARVSYCGTPAYTDRPRLRTSVSYTTARTTAERYADPAATGSSAEFRQRSLAEAMRILDGVRSRYRHLEELAPVVAVIDEVLALSSGPTEQGCSVGPPPSESVAAAFRRAKAKQLATLLSVRGALGLSAVAAELDVSGAEAEAILAPPHFQPGKRAGTFDLTEAGRVELLGEKPRPFGGLFGDDSEESARG